MTNAQVALQAAVAYSGQDAFEEDVLNAADEFKAWLDEQDAKAQRKSEAAKRAEAVRHANGWA